MKKFLILLCTLVVSLVTFSGCGNRSMGLGNYNFTKVHIFNEDGGVCCNVEKWYDAEVGIEVKTDKGALYLSEGTYMLVQDYCPICGK